MGGDDGRRWQLVMWELDLDLEVPPRRDGVGVLTRIRGLEVRRHRREEKRREEKRKVSNYKSERVVVFFPVEDSFKLRQIRSVPTFCDYTPPAPTH
ncbi:hypothetical protein Dsin_030810 [Dipteronia sinensis]|uniref:Uncharacterized protein n=1 Tax=Dipteronia sinensis TaxID=43782 RepID=A0AAD9ZLR7_9ROSI|nr:hypothetical protein Dsin_030810 [Dipteronia sinensis]